MNRNISIQQVRTRTEDFSSFPRTNQLAEKFENIASGKQGVPERPYVPHLELFRANPQLIAYCRTISRHKGIFYRHAISSIPYYFEEDCRLGLALSQYLLQKNRQTFCQTVGSGDGVFASALAEVGKGRIKVLTNTPTLANVRQFYQTNKRLGLPSRQRASMYHGSFYELNTEEFAVDPDLRPFRHGFDAIYETLTFQMYSADREHQIKLMKGRLAKNGILILCEKLNQLDRHEYAKREKLKDDQFKLRYFKQMQVKEKQLEILDTMQTMQVDEYSLSQAVGRHFRYAYVVWNSCNFYTIICSDSAIHLKRLIGQMTEVSIPQAFVFTTLPRPLLGFPNLNCSFQQKFQ